MSGQGSRSRAKSKTTSTNKADIQKDSLDSALELYIQQLGQNQNVFQGDRVAGLTGLQETGIGAAGGVGEAFTTPVSSPGFAGGPLAGETTTATSDLLTGAAGATPISSEQFGESFSRSISDPARKTFREETSPAISEAFAGPGFFSSARSKAQVKGKTDLEDSLQSSLAAGQFANVTRNQQLEEAKADRSQRAIPQAIQVGQAEAQTLRDNISLAASQVEGLKELMNIGGVEQSQEQKEIFASMEKFAQDNQITDPENLAIIMALLNMNFSDSVAKSRSRTDSGGGGVGAS
jgi:hypothetical protein